MSTRHHLHPLLYHWKCSDTCIEIFLDHFRLTIIFSAAETSHLEVGTYGLPSRQTPPGVESPALRGSLPLHGLLKPLFGSASHPFLDSCSQLFNYREMASLCYRTGGGRTPFATGGPVGPYTCMTKHSQNAHNAAIHRHPIWFGSLSDASYGQSDVWSCIGIAWLETKLLR